MTATRRLLLLVVGLAVSLVGCDWWMAGRPGDSAQLESGSSDSIRVNHQLHAKKYVFCEDCHGSVAESTSSSERFAPTEALCLDCHSSRKDDCAMCHTQVELRQAGRVSPARAAGVVFSHQGHLSLEEPKVDCKTCHADVLESTTRPTLPAMATCENCHNHRTEIADAQCTSCHHDLQQLPLQAMAQLDHGGDWISRHGLLAQSMDSECSQCHMESSCTGCHSRVAPRVEAELFPERVERTLLHRSDFISTHGMEARANGAMCMTCHNSESSTEFCSDCHSTVGLLANAADPRTPHPTGYVLRGGVAFHGDDARRHIETCTGCHDQGSATNCIDCHKTQGIGGNPHPASWSGAHDRAEIVGNPMCLQCHVDGR